MRQPRIATATLLVLCLAVPCPADVFPEGGVGITSAPDSVEQMLDRGCPEQFSTPDADRFRSYNIGVWRPWVDVDVDFLIDNQFGTHVLLNEVTDEEARYVLSELDLDLQNRFGWQSTDLGMTYQYFAESVPYDPQGEEHHFWLYPSCAGTPSLDYERDHLDLYLCPAQGDDDDPPLALCAGRTPSFHVDADEDPTSSEWVHNSVSVSDDFGNRVANPDASWPARSAHGAVHEFTHICWNSNTATYGSHSQWPTYDETIEYNELFACASGYLAVSPEIPLWFDVRYAYSLLHDRDDRPECKDPTVGGVLTTLERYRLWTIFGAYLGYQFHDPAGIRQSLLSRWSRNITTWPDEVVALERTFCGLAAILDDDEEFGERLGYAPPGTYGGYDGGYRVSRLFSDYGVARWVDCPIFENPPNGWQPYDFGPGFSPCWSLGQFRKIDDHGQYSQNAWWEFAIPPEFVLDIDNIGGWTAYPDVGDPACEDGWYDHENGQWFQHHGCVPIKVDLWGSNYLTFRADTDYFNFGMRDTLVVELHWGDTMNPHVELWLSVLRYTVSADSMFLRGQYLDLPVTTERYGPEDTCAVVRVEGFKENANEAVVIIPTLVATNYEGWMDPQYGCLTRKHYTDEPCVDLRYSYQFRVGVYDPGGGCPFVASRGEAGYVTDNNVLVGSPADGDVVDPYLLSHEPEAIDRAYHLRLEEHESDHSQFDRVELLAVDHAAGTGVAVFQDGIVGAYEVAGSPVACRDQAGNDVLDLVMASDGRKAEVQPGGWLEVTFAMPGGARGDGRVGTDGNPGQKIEPPGGGRDGGGPGTLDLTPLCYRENPCTTILDMPPDAVPAGDLLTLTLTSPVEYHLDRIFLAERTEGPLTIRRCELVSAQHSALGNCTSALSAADGSYADLTPGDVIDLAFADLPMAGVERDFVFVSRGHYDAFRGEGEPPEPEESSGVSLSAAASPNPFGPATTISFEVPHPGGHVAVSIYSMAGRLVRRLVDTEMSAGPHTLTWDGTGDGGERLGSGVYFYRIEVQGVADQRKLVLLK